MLFTLDVTTDPAARRATDIARLLAEGVHARTLLVRVSDAPDDALASSFARIPWEIARAPGDELTLRVHLDIESDDVDAEAARLEALGARRIEKVGTWWVMQSPTGQRFCVVRARRDLSAAPGANVWG